MGPIGAHAARRSEDDSIFRRRKAQKLGDDVVGNEEAKSKLEPIMRNSAIM
ncbi:FRG1-like family protein [Aspergillus luchuensis]|uniref:FRG1-like family protein n=1 Tax=Aspergillus kawachii TaxID=1069201 RepID=A0A146FDV0_ASPKA|nr:FRG1-like family protein [Aspergillus luchuensis]